MAVFLLPRGSIIPIIHELAIISAGFNQINTQAVAMYSLNPACVLKNDALRGLSNNFRAQKEKKKNIQPGFNRVNK